MQSDSVKQETQVNKVNQAEVGQGPASKNTKLIDDLFVRVCKRLKNFDRQLKESFLTLSTNFDRFKFIWLINVIHSDVDSVLESVKFDDKDDQKAKEYRLKGNEHYKTRRFFDALLNYNSCIRYAHNYNHAAKPSTTENDFNEQEHELALAYANRSAVFFHLDKYDLCLNDIEQAFKHGYPLKLKHKLVERKFNCLMRLECFAELMQMLKSESTIDPSVIASFEGKLEQTSKEDLKTILNRHKVSSFKHFDELKFFIERSERNTRIPSASNLISFDYSLEKGLHVKASRSIQVGDLLVDEMPYASVLVSEFIEKNCYECMQAINRLKMNVTHCRQCSLVTYCCDECERNAWKSHHKYECKFTRFLAYDSGITHMEWLAMRVVLKASFKYLWSVKASLETYELKYEFFKRDNTTIKEFDEVANVYKSDSYLAIFNLITNSSLRKQNDLFRRAFIALCLSKVLIKSKFIDSQNPNELKDQVCFIGGLLLRHLQSISCNAHEINQLRFGENVRKAMATSVLDGVGAGIYAVLSVFNHSCDPHVTRYFRGLRCQLRAIRSIEMNEEIFDNYGVIYATNNHEERQEKLLDQYFFQCSCLPCEKDWPMYDKLPVDLSINTFKCKECLKSVKEKKKECAQCQVELDQLKYEEMVSFQLFKTLLAFNADTDLDDENIRRKIKEIYTQFCKYLNLLETYKVKRPFKDYNNYQEPLKQCLNLIMRS